MIKSAFGTAVDRARESERRQAENFEQWLSRLAQSSGVIQEAPVKELTTDIEILSAWKRGATRHVSAEEAAASHYIEYPATPSAMGAFIDHLRKL